MQVDPRMREGDELRIREGDELRIREGDELRIREGDELRIREEDGKSLANTQELTNSPRPQHHESLYFG